MHFSLKALARKEKSGIRSVFSDELLRSAHLCKVLATGQKRAEQLDGSMLKATAIALILVAAVTPSNAGHKRVWKIVPGHKNIWIDVASIEPMRTISLPPRPMHIGIPPTDTTSLDIELNGHFFGGYMIDCSGPGVNRGTATVYMPQNKLNEPPSRIMGYVPGGVIEALACPIAADKRSHAPK